MLKMVCIIDVFCRIGSTSLLLLFNTVGVNVSGVSNCTSKIFISLNIRFLVILFKCIKKASTKSFNPI